MDFNFLYAIGFPDLPAIWDPLLLSLSWYNFNINVFCFQQWLELCKVISFQAKMCQIADTSLGPHGTIVVLVSFYLYFLLLSVRCFSLDLYSNNALLITTSSRCLHWTFPPPCLWLTANMGGGGTGHYNLPKQSYNLGHVENFNSKCFFLKIQS